jgi:hypothetical protein
VHPLRGAFVQLTSDQTMEILHTVTLLGVGFRSNESEQKTGWAGPAAAGVLRYCHIDQYPGGSRCRARKRCINEKLSLRNCCT